MANFCSSCGNALTGAFCTNCGVSQTQAAATPAAAYSAPAAPKRPRNPKIAQLLIPIGLAVVAAISLALGISQAVQITTHANAARIASDMAAASYDSADSFDSLATDARIEKEACYYNDYCSSESYSNWINIVDTDESLAESSRETAQSEEAIAARELKGKTTSQVVSIVGFVFAALSIAGLGFVLVLRGRRKKAAPVIANGANAATAAE
ncbi:MAG: hypothetical protein KGL77_01750 [Actinomycetales bacterium]|nr:hypothetical protein [Actinomycetales bacterium]